MFLILISGASAHAADQLNEMTSKENLKIIADYLGSLDHISRTHLASKLYYLDPSLKKMDAQSTLLDELVKSGRVSNEKNNSMAPKKTDRCWTGDSL